MPEKPTFQDHKKIKNVKHDYSKIFDWILLYKSKNDGLFPSMREIGESQNITSTSVVTYILAKMCDYGYLYRLDDGPGGRIRYGLVGGKYVHPELENINEEIQSSFSNPD